jgi:polysaccharide chain length determinant protein (PEP-CTERM system associated)
MRKHIDIEVVQSSDRVPSSFKIYYSSPSPDIAQQVNSELTNSLINGSLENDLADIDRQNKVLDSGLEDARAKLATQEDKVRQYKDRHMGELPSTLQSNLQILAGKQSQLQNEQEGLNQARQRRAYLESALTQYNTIATTIKPGETPVGLPALDQELQRLKAQLTDLSARYTDQHPDVRKLKEQIASTQKIRDQLAAQLKSKSDGPSDAANDPTSSAPLIEVRSQLKANELEIANRERAITGLQAEINGYQGRLGNTPIREQELADLNRDYDQLKAFYDQLLNKKNQAIMAEKIAREQQGDRFTMQDPPSKPSKPDSPNRFKLGLLGLFAGLAMGLVVAGGVEFLDDRVYDEAIFKQMVPAEVLVEIPALHTPEEIQQQKQWQKFSFAGIGLIGIIVVLGTAISFLRG